MSKTPLNDNVRTLCARHWDGTDAGCSRCPIHVACHSGPTARLSYDDLEAHRVRRNEAADAAITATKKGGEHAD